MQHPSTLYYFSLPHAVRIGTRMLDRLSCGKNGGLQYVAESSWTTFYSGWGKQKYNRIAKRYGQMILRGSRLDYAPAYVPSLNRRMLGRISRAEAHANYFDFGGLHLNGNGKEALAHEWIGVIRNFWTEWVMNGSRIVKSNTFAMSLCRHQIYSEHIHLESISLYMEILHSDTVIITACA